MKREDLYIRIPAKQDGTYNFITELGGDPEAIARMAGLGNASEQENIRYVSWAKLCKFFELTAEDLNDPYFGLKWAMNIPKDLRNMGPTIYIGSLAKNMRHLLDMLVSYLKIYTNGVTINYEEDVAADTVTGVIEVNPLSPPCRQYCEHIMASIAEMGRRFVPDFKINSVTFQYSAPNDTAWYETAFQCPVYFNANRNTLVVDRSYLGDEGASLGLKLVTPLLKTYLKWSVERHPHFSNSMLQLLTQTLPAIIGAGNSDIVKVAAALQLHPKKLQRLLTDEGTNYSKVLDEVRLNLAKRLLLETDISIGRIAKALDYTTDRAFTAATKRWFGMPPTKYRNFIRRVEAKE